MHLVKAALVAVIAMAPATTPFPPGSPGPPAAMAAEPVTAGRQNGAARTGAEAEERRRLLADLKAAPDEALGRAAEDALWRFWMRVTDETTQGMVADAIAARQAYDFDRALTLLNTVVERVPDYSEGWNQRAFIWFLKQDYEKSLEDLDRALALEPMHFAALAGKGLNFLGMGRRQLAINAIRQAVAIHPWLKERHMIPPDRRDEGIDL
jgi:tetratricopeptide (TPR) repeat protein